MVRNQWSDLLRWGQLITILLVDRSWPTWSAARRRLLGEPQPVGEHSDLTSQTDSLRIPGTYPTDRTPTPGNPLTTKWKPMIWPNSNGYRLVDAALASPSCYLQDLATYDKTDLSLRYSSQNRQLRSIQATRKHVSLDLAQVWGTLTNRLWWS